MKIYNAIIIRIADEEIEHIVISRYDFNHCLTAEKDYFEAELGSIDDGPDGEGGWLDDLAEYSFDEQTGEFYIRCEDLNLNITGHIVETELL